MSVEQDLARARRKPIPEDKMRALLTKARKGATASFTLTNLVQILDTLGWQMEPTYGWAAIHYMHSDGEQLVYEHGREHPTPADVEAMERKRQSLIDVQHTELPEAGPDTVNGEVVMEVGPLRKGYNDLPLFEYKKWVGVEGVRFINPRGEEIDVLPDRAEVSYRKVVVMTESKSFASSSVAWRALKELGIEDDINTFLGTEKHIPAEQRTRENTGTCAHCWGNYKLENGRLVLHGYKRPRYGFVVGQCRGVRYLPLEKSPLGAEDCLDDLKNNTLAQWVRNKEALESGEVEKLEIGKNRFINKGEPHFEYHVKEAIRRAKRMIEEIERDVELYEKVIKHWHERPMPKEGELQRGPGFFTK